MHILEQRADPENAIHLPDGCSIIGAFRQIVLEDPSVIAARNALPPNDTNAAVFEHCQYPGPIIHYLWPISITASDLAYDFVRPFAFYCDARLPKASPALTTVAEALADRWLTLISLLQSQRLVASGTYHATGQTNPIDRMTWFRKNMVVDLENGDLAEIVNHKASILWRGLSVSMASVELDLTDRPQEKSSPLTPPPTSKLTAVEASIRAAILNLWPTGVPAELSKKVRDARIIEWQRANDATPTSSKAIYRYMKRFGSR